MSLNPLHILIVLIVVRGLLKYKTDKVEVECEMRVWESRGGGGGSGGWVYSKSIVYMYEIIKRHLSCYWFFPEDVFGGSLPL